MQSDRDIYGGVVVVLIVVLAWAWYNCKLTSYIGGPANCKLTHFVGASASAGYPELQPGAFQYTYRDCNGQLQMSPLTLNRLGYM